MDMIQDNWSPIYTVCSMLMAIRSLLTDPNCKPFRPQRTIPTEKLTHLAFLPSVLPESPKHEHSNT